MRCSSQAFLWATNLDLHTQHIPHGLCGFLLCRSGDMGIGVQSEPGREVAQHAADRLDIHAVLEGEGCEGVAEVMESDLRDACPFEDTLQHIVDAVWGDGSAVGGWEYILVVGFGFLIFENFY